MFAACAVVALTVTATSNSLTRANIEVLAGNYQLELAPGRATEGTVRYLPVR